MSYRNSTILWLVGELEALSIRLSNKVEVTSIWILSSTRQTTWSQSSCKSSSWQSGCLKSSLSIICVMHLILASIRRSFEEFLKPMLEIKSTRSSESCRGQNTNFNWSIIRGRYCKTAPWAVRDVLSFSDIRCWMEIKNWPTRVSKLIPCWK